MAGEQGTVDGLFGGMSFFLTQRLPTRSHYVSEIEANGGRVVKLEAQADYVICDHMRKEVPAGAYSFMLIEIALRERRFPDAERFRVGPPRGSVRVTGSATAPRSTRTAFTAEDDAVLWDWVQNARACGGSDKGNEIYKALEATNPRHTYQAWRDRYVKRLINQPPPKIASPSQTAPATSTSAVTTATVADPLTALAPESQSKKRKIDQVDTHVDPARSHGQQRVGPQRTSSSVPIQMDSVARLSVGANEGRLNVGVSDSGSTLCAPEATGDAVSAVSLSSPSASEDRSVLADDTSPGTSRHALTKANLALQRAQNEPPLVRGTDLPEDSETEDRTEFIEYLQKLTQSARAGANSEQRMVPHGMEGSSAAEQGLPRNAQTDEDTAMPSRSQALPTIPPHEAHQGEAAEWLDDDDDEAQEQQQPQKVFASMTCVDEVPDDEDQPRRLSSHVHTEKAIALPRDDATSRDQLSHGEHPAHSGPGPDSHASIYDSMIDEFDLDLSVPEPDEGFDIDQFDGVDSSSRPDSPSWDASRQPTASPQMEPVGAIRRASGGNPSGAVKGYTKSQALDTQDIYRAKSHTPELGIAPPAEPRTGLTSSRSVLATQSSQRGGAARYTVDISRESTLSMEDDMETWIVRMRNKGHQQGAILAALQCTSMRPDLAEFVLLERRHGKGLPGDVPGIWTEDDDHALEGGDARLLRAVEEKHGWKELLSRRSFLEDFRELSG